MASTFFTIPARNDLPWYTFQITLDNVIYTLVFRYNTRSSRWLLDINDASNNPILIGIPLLINRNLTAQFNTLAIPAGTMFCTDDTNQDMQPTQYTFGITNTLWYEDT